MKNLYVFLLALPIVFFSCKKSKTDKMLGAWRGVSLDNPVNENYYKETQNYIDTMGKNNSAITNFAIYETTNMDSLRKLYQEELDSLKIMQLNAVKKAIFTFKTDSIVVISFNGVMDTSKWFVNKEGNLEMEEISGPKKGEKVTVNIIDLKENELKLRFVEDSAYSTVTFVRNGK